MYKKKKISRVIDWVQAQKPRKLCRRKGVAHFDLLSPIRQ